MTGDTSQHDFDGPVDAAQGWQDCRGGEISSCVRDLVSRRRVERRSRIVQSTITVAGLLVVLGLGSLWMIAPQATVAEACCQDVRDVAEQYVHHELDPEMTARVERHLHDCPRCQQHIDSLAQRLKNTLSWIWRQPEFDRSLDPLGNEQNPRFAVHSTIHAG